jgi:hypothetical protein
LLTVLTGGEPRALNELAGELLKRAEFALIEETAEDLFDGEIATYRPGQDRNLVVIDHHWKPLIEQDSYRLSPNFKMMELFLASRGGLTVVLPSDNPLIDMLHRQTITSVKDLGDLDTDDIIALAGSMEAEALPYDRWRHYIGVAYPQWLVICQPDREVRRDFIGRADEDDWTQYGFASSGATPEELDLLWLTLDSPQLLGVGKLSQQIENWLATRGAAFTNVPLLT